MSRIGKQVVCAAAVGLAIAALGVSGSGSTSTAMATPATHGPAGSAGSIGEPTIVGTWLVAVTPSEGQPLQAMVIFAPGGGVIETESGDQGTGIGSWRALDGGRVAVTFQRFEFDAQGAYVGRAVVRTEIAVSGDQFTGPYDVQGFDPQGNVVFTGAGTAVGTRFPVQPS
jgi:hypothetical protein